MEAFLRMMTFKSANEIRRWTLKKLKNKLFVNEIPEILDLG